MGPGVAAVIVRGVMSSPDALRERLRSLGLDPEREARLLAELEEGRSHCCPPSDAAGTRPEGFGPESPYAWSDPALLQGLSPQVNATLAMQSLDELLARDRKREEDGFPRKIRVGRMVKPGSRGKDKVVVVPSTVEEKFYHDRVRAAEEEEAGGTGEGEEGEVIGEQPVRPEGGGGAGPGQGEGASHDVESSAYDLGRILTEQFQLPNLQDKGKKRSLTRFTYDLTDRHRGFGQILDKKATLRRIVQTNIELGRVPDPGAIDLPGLLVSPNDRIYRILSREKDFESQAMVFFLRDYSGSMGGKPTELVVTQHILIYSWLLYQYERQVESRFILHDTEAKEVSDFHTYSSSSVAGGTQVASAYRLVNEIVDKENLVRDYNIYIFHGTDGDDWDSDGTTTLPELKRMLSYASRVGITIARDEYNRGRKSEVEKYLKTSGLLDAKNDYLRMDVLQSDADEKQMIESIKALIS